MTDDQSKINDLYNKLNALLSKQNDFYKEINALRREIDQLRTQDQAQDFETTEIQKDSSVTDSSHEILNKEISSQPSFRGSGKLKEKVLTRKAQRVREKRPKRKSDLEKFVGENLINKIGIVITVIGVAIGAKYSIEHDLISPLTRIVLGYVAGLGLLGFGIKLKKNYENYSAVLVSGAMAILYFITYAAYDLYALLPQLMAFVLMVVFTAFTVLAAIHYNRQVIAHIGLVGAYAVPFLLSDGSGRAAILFSYVTMINVGILVIAFKRYWKLLYYTSFGLSWLIYLAWLANSYRLEEHFWLAMIFASLFFLTFYLTFLAYKLLRKEVFKYQDIILILLNSFIFYGIGYGILSDHETGKHLLGFFTLCNALIHFVVGIIIYRKKLADRNLFYLISGLVLVFITIAVPVQLDGNWVTLLWAGEAALLFWIGRTKKVPVYEKLSYPLMVLAFLSLAHDWLNAYHSFYPTDTENRITPLQNIHFLTGILFVAAFAFINKLDRDKSYGSAIAQYRGISKLASFVLPGILLFALYNTFRLEIANYWNQLYADSYLAATPEGEIWSQFHWNFDLREYRKIWIINYSLLFVSLLAFANVKKLKSSLLGTISLGLITLALTVFLIQGLYVLSELRESYLEQKLAEVYNRGIYNIFIRYISFLFVAMTLVACHKLLQSRFVLRDFRIAFELLFHVAILWIASSELIHWIDFAESTQSYKLGLSILWGVYSLLLIALGIWKKKKYLRIGAISLFGLTLVKLFFYDISHLDTIDKTIVFVSLGVLLLIISFLYHKFKNDITDEAAD
ncbi:hypothetical protein BST97_04170 [Nonlabens spongiae]|uniref:DUF2339 domain-containing protein n=1 Tax=Nonlabens spongiae TaxID=331648 RepID=A0A1W6MI28_9FLAO|nr:DUF2339 domain-containing protein [Nonlabens spongiae]ARN77240.1 hypothetical protein BST97_04170 [Nonlabens spongiae]